MGYLDNLGLTYFWNKINAKLSKKADLVDGKIPTEQLPDDEIVYIPFLINDGSFSLTEGVTYDTILEYYRAGLHIYATATIIDDSYYGTLGEMRIPLVRYCDSYEQPFFSFLLSNEIRTVEIMVNADGSIFSFIHTVQTLSNMVTSISEASRNDQYPSALAVHTAIQDAIADVGSGGGGGFAEQEIFYVPMTYEDGEVSLNDVTAEDMLNAYESGKTLIAKVDGYQGVSYVPFSCVNGNKLSFYAIQGRVGVSIIVIHYNDYTQDSVSLSEQELQVKSRLVTSISASSTDSQYPSAKAVYEYVQAIADVGSGGGGESTSNTFIVKLLTSLSASGISLSLPSDVTYTDVNDAVDNGLHVIAIADIPSVAGDIAGTYAIPFAYKDTSGNLIFSVMVRDMNLGVIITPSGAISFTYFFAEQSGRRMDSISSSDTHMNYPSSKAVYDFVQNEKQIEYIDGTFEMSTMSYSTDTTFEEIISMVNKGKYVVAMSTITFGGTPTNIAWLPLSAINPSSVAVFEGTMQADLGALNPAYSLVLLAISVEICPDGTINTRVRVVSTTNLN